MNDQVKKLMLLPQPQQRTEEWYAARRNKITASSLSSLLVKDDPTCDPYIESYGLYDFFDKNNKCCNPYSSRQQFIIDKCGGSSFKGSVATYWGQKYEPVVTDLYSLEYNTPVLEFGLIAHQGVDWLAASPDGITPDGVMIEIKCPYRRKITGIPPFYYWIQVQIQLEVCDLDTCDFVEVGFTEYQSLYEFLDDSTESDTKPLEKGLFLQIEEIPDKLEKRKFMYPPKEILKDVPKLLKWKDKTISDYLFKTKYTPILSTEPNILCKDSDVNVANIKIVYWKVPVKSVVRIKRDKKWFADVYPHLLNEKNSLRYYNQNDNYKQLIKPKSNTSSGSTSGNGSGTSVVHNDATHVKCVMDSDDE